MEQVHSGVSEYISVLNGTLWDMEQVHSGISESQNAPVPYPTMLHSEQKRTHFCSAVISLLLADVFIKS